jgi:hypothetical protein
MLHFLELDLVFFLFEEIKYSHNSIVFIIIKIILIFEKKDMEEEIKKVLSLL